MVANQELINTLQNMFFIDWCHHTCGFENLSSYFLPLL